MIIGEASYKITLPKISAKGDSMQQNVTILCMKWGTAYGSDYVNKLFGMVQRHLHRPFRFVCFTENSSGIRHEIEIMPLPDLPVPIQHQCSPWRKLSMFAKGLVGTKGMALFLDLDLVIVDDIDPFFDYGNPKDFVIIENWTQLGQGIGNSSIYRFSLDEYSFIYDTYLQDPDAICSSFDNEQVYLSREVVRNGGELKFWPKEWCTSFKRHCLGKGIGLYIKRPIVPNGTKIVVFHGYPKPENAANGQYPTKPWRKYPKAIWVNDYWVA